jgi:hypothetical protein
MEIEKNNKFPFSIDILFSYPSNYIANIVANSLNVDKELRNQEIKKKIIVNDNKLLM